MFGECFENVRRKTPLIHNITNYVTVNDVANIELACGGSPIMSDEEEDAADITAQCNGLNINIGTLHKTNIPGMLASGGKANELGHPVLLDPVGVGVSRFRTDTVNLLMEKIHFAVIRDNISEIRTVAAGNGNAKGVDADAAEAVTEENLNQNIEMISKCAAQLHTVIAVTGAIDLVSDGKTCYVIRNGRPEMGSITGTGCQLSGMMTAFIAANPDNILQAAAEAVCTMGLAGEIGWTHMKDGEGNSSYRNHIIDAVYNMNADILRKGAKYEVR